MRENRKSQYNAIHVYKEKVEKPTSKTAENFRLFYHFFFSQENKPPFANKALRDHSDTQIMVKYPPLQNRMLFTTNSTWTEKY